MTKVAKLAISNHHLSLSFTDLILVANSVLMVKRKSLTVATAT